MKVGSLGAVAALLVGANLLTALPAQAATFVAYTPQTVYAPGISAGQNVTPVGTVSLSMTATQTAYVVSKMRVNSATIRSLFDNEVVCSGPGGWTKNMVTGQNVYHTGSGSPQWEDVTLYTRFLIHPGAAGTVTCTANVRGHSLGFDPATYQLVSGYLQFADFSVTNATNGSPAQASVVPPVIGVSASNPVVRQPALDYFNLPSGVDGLNVVGDTEFMICWPSSPCNKYGSTAVRFTLFVNQWKQDGSLCKTDGSMQLSMNVPYWVHHIYVPLNKPNFAVSEATGCIRRFNAYVKVEWLGGQTGAVQGTALGLPDSFPDAPGPEDNHDADMSHAFVLPY